MDIKSITNVYNNAIGRAIVRKKIPHFRILKKSSTFQVGLGYKQRRFLYDDINSSAASRICNNKSFTKYFLRQLGVPVPVGEKIYNADDLEREFKTIKKPVVIKPVSEMWGKGISTNITTLDGARRAYAIAAQFHGEYVIMEEHIMGDDYRILFLGGKYIAGLKRTPPFVIGNGTDTIENLIAKENAQRKKSVKIIKEILVDLMPREQKILRMRFGLDDGITHTLEEVGKEFGVTRERIRQIEAKAHEKIRQHDKAKRLMGY